MCATNMIAIMRWGRNNMFPFGSFPTPRPTTMADLPLQAPLSPEPKSRAKSRRKRTTKSSEIHSKSPIRQKSRNAASQPHDRQGRFAPKPSVFTHILDGIERAQRTVKKVRRLIKRAYKPERPIRRRVIRVRRPQQYTLPQPLYRRSVKEHLVGRIRRCLGRS